MSTIFAAPAIYVFRQNLGYFVFIRRVKSHAIFFNSTKPNALTQPRPSRMPFLSACSIDNPLSSLFQTFRYSSDVFERLMSTGSKRFSLLICLDVTKFFLAKCLYSYRGDLPKNLFKITAQGCKKDNFRLTSVAPRSCCLSSLLGTGQSEVSRKHSEGWHFTIIRTNLSESRLLGSSLIPYIPLTFPESRTVFWWNPGSSEYPFRTGMKLTPLGKHSVISKGKSTGLTLGSPYINFVRDGRHFLRALFCTVIHSDWIYTAGFVLFHEC